MAGNNGKTTQTQTSLPQSSVFSCQLGFGLNGLSFDTASIVKAMHLAGQSTDQVRQPLLESEVHCHGPPEAGWRR